MCEGPCEFKQKEVAGRGVAKSMSLSSWGGRLAIRKRKKVQKH